ncbi:hypothetical protein SNE40_011313 [Patella caerulea]|uniref:RNA helicase n=2 Tax=Patella caerulea TaxID=87958 RepID=A0AAN8PP72_PATCE
MGSFSELGLNDWLVKQCKAMGLTKSTPIQQKCVPPILKGEDCIGCAKTGSGKTAAFALPVLQKLSEDPFGIFALVLTPTRELAFQICEQFRVLGKPIGVRVTVITGGLDMNQQGIDLAVKPHIVISTPGRLASHIENCDTFSLKKIKFLILDEADRLLEDDFGQQLETIFGTLPKKRQTLLFSATSSPTFSSLMEVSDKKPFFWQQESTIATVEELDQRYVLCSADVKDAYMFHVLDKFLEKNPKSSVMIFTNTCKYAQILGMILQEMGVKCVILHSTLRQPERLASLASFKSHKVRIMIATDVASRGLDIPTVDLIINHNVPNRPKDYVHRVGRTARAGRGGTAITMVTQFDVKLVHAIEDFTNYKMKEHQAEESEVMDILTEIAVSRREAEIRLDERDFGQQKILNKRKRIIMDGEDPEAEAQRKEEVKRKFKDNNKIYKEYCERKKKKEKIIIRKEKQKTNKNKPRERPSTSVQ